MCGREVIAVQILDEMNFTLFITVKKFGVACIIRVDVSY